MKMGGVRMRDTALQYQWERVPRFMESFLVPKLGFWVLGGGE